MIQLSHDISILKLPRKLRSHLNDVGVRTMDDLKRLRHHWTTYGHVAQQLFVLRFYGQSEVRCSSCKSLLILYPRMSLKACPNCDSKAIPCPRSSLVYQAFPELVSE